MKYCPNPACPTLKEFGLVAEYEDHVIDCEDCGTLLIAADSPPEITPSAPLPSDTGPEPFEDASLLGSFELLEDAEACQRELEKSRIPTQVQKLSQDSETQPGNEPLINEADDATQATFSLFVRRQDIFRAMNVLDGMFGDDAGEIAEDECSEDNAIRD